MEFKGRSFYNLLRVSEEQDECKNKENYWRLWDYETFSEEKLFAMLKELGVTMPKEHFILYAENCDSPEELVECLWVDESNVEGEEKVYLIVFELWKRCLPHKRCLSIFFDEFDSLICLFDEGHLLDEEKMRSILLELEDIFQHTKTTQAAREELFSYAAHDIEAFLYDYIGELLEEGNEGFASLLINAFKKNVVKKRWFAFLQIRLLMESDLEEFQISLDRLVEEAKEEKDDLFLEEVQYFFADTQELSESSTQP